jgi:DNA transformation protein
MSDTPEFVAHALDLLAPLGLVEARRMFGGHGLYARGVMFGILDDEELFLKADDEARPIFEAAGCRQWSYPTKKGPMPGDYWRPPDEAHEDPEAMRPWAELGLGAAVRKAAARAAKGMGTRARAPAKRTKAPPAKSRAAPKGKPAATAPGKAKAKARPAKRAAPKRKATRR